MQGFAKRQPAAFLGATVLGGFAVVRLLRTPTVSHKASGGMHDIDKGHSLVVATRPANATVASDSSSGTAGVTGFGTGLRTDQR